MSASITMYMYSINSLYFLIQIIVALKSPNITAEHDSVNKQLTFRWNTEESTDNFTLVWCKGKAIKYEVC